MAVLGLTVLAWGNSIGDLVADVAVARAGSPDMAVTACFAGPLFNMLVGLGVAFFIQCVYTKKAVPINLAGDTWTSLHVSFVGLSSILCATCVAAAARNFTGSSSRFCAISARAHPFRSPTQHAYGSRRFSTRFRPSVWRQKSAVMSWLRPTGQRA